MIVWKSVVDWEGFYDVSRCGLVKSLSRVVIRSNGRPCKVRERLLKQNKNSNNYLSVTLQQQGHKVTLPVYILVAGAFLGKTPLGLEILHGPLGKSVNNVNNLSFGTHQQNSMDMLRDGLESCKPVLVGTKHFPSINSAARFLGVDVSNVSMALRRGWKCQGEIIKYERT